MIGFLKNILFGRSITSQQCTKLACHIKNAETENPNEQIIEYDKVYHHILKKLGYSGSFGEILKRNPKEIKNINDVWELHKLRNVLVHDLKQPKNNLEDEALRYRLITEKFLSQVTR